MTLIDRLAQNHSINAARGSLIYICMELKGLKITLFLKVPPLQRLKHSSTRNDPAWSLLECSLRDRSLWSVRGRTKEISTPLRIIHPEGGESCFLPCFALLPAPNMLLESQPLALTRNE